MRYLNCDGNTLYSPKAIFTEDKNYQTISTCVPNEFLICSQDLLYLILVCMNKLFDNPSSNKRNQFSSQKIRTDVCILNIIPIEKGVLNKLSDENKRWKGYKRNAAILVWNKIANISISIGV